MSNQPVELEFFGLHRFYQLGSYRYMIIILQGNGMDGNCLPIESECGAGHLVLH
jgi:hypothetical protein